MPAREAMREFVSGPLTAEQYQQKASEGWKLFSIEWRRESETSSEEALEEVPFGLRVARDCVHLEVDPVEKRALLLILGMIVRENSLAAVADELNRRGCRTRGGTPWTASDIFELHPRLIEVFPKVLASREWEERKESLLTR